MANYHKHFEWLRVQLVQRYGDLDKAYVDWLQRLHSRNAEISDAALYDIRQIAQTYPKQILATFLIISEELRERIEDNNEQIYNWYHLALIEGLEHIRSPDLIPQIRSALYTELYSSNVNARLVAVQALEQLGRAGDKESRKILWNARNTQFNDPNETEQFRTAIKQSLQHS